MAANIKIWWPVVRLPALCTLRLAAEYQRFPSPFDQGFLYPPFLLYFSLTRKWKITSKRNNSLRPIGKIDFSKFLGEAVGKELAAP